MAQVREKEKERIFDRKLLKEREQEDAQFGDKPKFLTAAYKQKLLDEKKWEYEDKLAEKVERRTDVRGSGMTGFYANLLTKNIAMGGDVGTSSTSAYTVGNERQKRLINDEPYLSAVSESAGFNDAHISDQVKTSDDVTSTGDNISKIDDEKGAYKSGKHGRDYEDVTADSQTYPLQKMRTEEVHQKRQEVVLSARERFLARKQQQQQYES